MCKYVGYIRVSTAKQGKSGLGLEAQEQAIADFIRGKGENGTLLQTYREVESGKRNDRPELRKAMDYAELTGATLLIGKLDRLSRDAHFLLGLQKAGVKFTACDMPEADQFTVGIMALVAQREREAISKRTREALQAAKARGVKLGNPNGVKAIVNDGRAKGTASIVRKADERAGKVAGTIRQLQAEGLSSNAIAKRLNETGIETPRQGLWTAKAVIRVLDRLA